MKIKKQQIGLQATKKQISLLILIFFIDKQVPRSFLFLQETDSAKEKKKRWIDDFNDKIYVSHLKIDSCGVLIAVYDHFNICTNHRVNHNDTKIMRVEPTLDGSDDLLTNLNNDDIKKKTVNNNESPISLVERF